MADLSGFPRDMKVEESIISKTLKSGLVAEVRLVKMPRQYEAALFLDGKYKAGPPVPRQLENATGDVTHWMGVRPSVGFTSEEAEAILGEVRMQNMLHHCWFQDKWGPDYD